MTNMKGREMGCGELLELELEPEPEGGATGGGGAYGDYSGNFGGRKILTPLDILKLQLPQHTP